MRRGFYDLAKAGAAPIATEALARIAALYRIEAEIRGHDAGHRLKVRRAKSRPLVADLRTWFETQAAKLPARGPTAVAIRYALNHWDGLERFLDDGRIELDTNTVERAMRPVALSRKNSLFAGSDVGAPFCSSGDALTKQRSSGADREKPGAVTSWLGRRVERRPAAGRQARLSRAPQRTAAGPGVCHG